MRGYLVIPIWLACFVGTTVFLLADWLYTGARTRLTGKRNPPYFELRSIFCGDDDEGVDQGADAG